VKKKNVSTFAEWRNARPEVTLSTSSNGRVWCSSYQQRERKNELSFKAIITLAKSGGQALAASSGYKEGDRSDHVTRGHLGKSNGLEEWA